MSLQLTLALRYLLGRKLRTILTTLAIVFGVMIIFGLNGILPAVEASFRASMRVDAHQVDLVVTHTSGGVFDEAQAQRIGELAGVEMVVPALEQTVVLPADFALPAVDGSRLVNALDVSGWDPQSSAAMVPFQVIEGRWIQPGEMDTMMVHQNFAERTGLGIGETVRLPAARGSESFRIVGILNEQALFDEEDVYISLPAAQTLFHLPGQISAISANFADGTDAEALRQEALEVLGPGYQAGSIDQGGSEWESAFRLGQMAFTLFGVLALAMGGFVMFNTFRTVVVERRRDIGMLRAIGASRRMVVGTILVEGLLQGILGTTLGLLLGYLLLNALLPLLNPTWESFFHAPLGTPSFSLPVVLVSALLGIGIPLLAGLLPARAAGRISPLEALRSTQEIEDRAASRRRLYWSIGLAAVALLGLASGNLGLASLGALLFLVALVMVSPLLVAPIANLFGRILEWTLAREGHLAQGNLVRQPGRAAVTASAVMISMAILVALAGVASTSTIGMMGYLEQSMRADYLVVPQALILNQGNVAAQPELAQRVREVPGITAVTTIRLAETRAEVPPPSGLMQQKMAAQGGESTLQVLGIDPRTYPELAGLIFSTGDPNRAYAQLAEGRYLIANGTFAAQNGLNVGSEVVLHTANGPQAYQMVGIGIDYLNSKQATVYISQDNLARDFHVTGDVMLMANRAEGTEINAVENSMLTLLSEYPAFTLFSYERWRELQLQGNNARSYALYVLMALLAVPSLIALANTLGINVLERRREIGVLRAVGASRKQVSRVIVAESLLLSALGLACGILAGLWLGYVLVGALNASGMFMPYTFPLGGVLLAVAVGLLFGVLAALVPARHAAGMNIVEALRYE